MIMSGRIRGLCLGFLLVGGGDFPCQMVAGFTVGQSDDLSLTIADFETGISHVSTVFVKEQVAVTVDNIIWEGSSQEDSFFMYTTSINGKVAAEGNHTLPQDALALPSSIFVGHVYVSDTGPTTILVKMQVSGSKTSTSTSIQVQSIRKWITLLPLLVIIFVSVKTSKIECGFIAGIFATACIVTGTIAGGFTTMINTYLLEAIADLSHIYM